MLLILGIAWGLFFALHSLFADAQVRAWIIRNTLLTTQHYRLFYNAFAIITILPPMYLQVSTRLPLWFSPTYLTSLLALTLCCLGLCIIVLSFKNYRLREFLGMDALTKNKESAVMLHTSGLNAWVRHPLYFGIILSTLGYLLFRPHAGTLVLLVVTFIYLRIGTYLEEQKLVKEFGEAYKEYQKKVAMLLPYIF